jgi:hypothetical protein
VTTPDPDPPAQGPSSPDDSPTSPLDLPPFTTVESPSVSAVPPPAGPPPGSSPPDPVPPTAPSIPPPGAQPAPSSGAWGSSPLPPDRGTPAPAGATPTGAASSARPGSEPNSQAALVIGLLLVIIGAVVLLTRVADVTFDADAWPLWIIVPGLAMLLASFAVPPRGGLGLAVPGAIIATVGLVLWVQEANDAYETWAYAWALVAPTAAGAGTMLYGLVKGDSELAGDGFRTTLVGLALFGGFALFFEGVLGLSGEPIANLDEVLPYALIGLGLLMVVLAFVGGGRRRERRAR